MSSIHEKSADYFNKAGVTLRNQTQWGKLVDHGIARLTGAHTKHILDAIHALQYVDSFPHNLYGNGRAAEKICQLLNDF